MPLGCAAAGADVKIDKLGRSNQMNRAAPIRNDVAANVALESWVPIKLLLRLLRCRNTGMGISRLLICRRGS
jgi:hypothetical protein